MGEKVKMLFKNHYYVYCYHCSILTQNRFRMFFSGLAHEFSIEERNDKIIFFCFLLPMPCPCPWTFIWLLEKYSFYSKYSSGIMGSSSGQIDGAYGQWLSSYMLLDQELSLQRLEPSNCIWLLLLLYYYNKVLSFSFIFIFFIWVSSLLLG